MADSIIEPASKKRKADMLATVLQNGTEEGISESESLILSSDPLHPANHICELCRNFYTFGWVTGTGGGVSIKNGEHIYIAPSGVQKELMRPTDMFVMKVDTGEYLRRPAVLKPSACTPLFLAAFNKRGAGCCIHTHSQWAVLVTLICESNLQDTGGPNIFSISQIEQIKGISRGGHGSSSTEILEGGRKAGNLGYFDKLKIPIIENTAHEEDLRDTLEKAIEAWPDTTAVLVRRHGVYVWGKDVAQAKTQCESLDFLFQLAVEMHKMGLNSLSRLSNFWSSTTPPEDQVMVGTGDDGGIAPISAPGNDTDKSPKNCPLLDTLPREIRAKIWVLALHEPEGIKIHHKLRTLEPNEALALTKTCRVVRQETYKLFFELNELHYDICTRGDQTDNDRFVTNIIYLTCGGQIKLHGVPRLHFHLDPDSSTMSLDSLRLPSSTVWKQVAARIHKIGLYTADPSISLSLDRGSDLPPLGLSFLLTSFEQTWKAVCCALEPHLEIGTIYGNETIMAPLGIFFDGLFGIEGLDWQDYNDTRKKPSDKELQAEQMLRGAWDVPPSEMWRLRKEPYNFDKISCTL